MNKKPRENHQKFVVTTSEVNKNLEHKNHIITIQLHKKRKQDLIDILIGWFEADFDETVRHAKGKKVKHCSECGTPYIYAHKSCPQGDDDS